MGNKIQNLFKALKVGKQLKVKGKGYTIKDIKLANAGYDYAKVKVSDGKADKYLEFYWEKCPYFGIGLSWDIDEFSDLTFDNFKAPEKLEGKGIAYTLYDKGHSIVTGSDGSGDYKKGDKVYFWEYFDDDHQSRISLGYNARSKKWLNMFAQKVAIEDIELQPSPTA